jgi:hypothetical protein
MPGPYCEPVHVYQSVQATLGQAAGTELPEHWGPLADRALKRGYQRLIGILGGRGYSTTVLDSWSGRDSYNLDLAVAYAFMYGAFRRDEDAPSARTELDRIDKELSDPKYLLFDDSGGILQPDITLSVGSNPYSSGRFTGHDDDAADIAAWKAGFIDDNGTIYEVLP